MSFWTDIEAEYNSVIASADTVAVKLDNLMGIQTRAAQMTALQNQIQAILEDGSKANADKVTEILTAVGKL